MNPEDLQRFAEDLRRHAGLIVEVFQSSRCDGLHVLRINGVEFFFYADRCGYDGWGQALPPACGANQEGSDGNAEQTQGDAKP